MIGLEGGRKKMEVSLGGVAHTDSFEASAGDVERDFTLDQAPERGHFK